MGRLGVNAHVNGRSLTAQETVAGQLTWIARGTLGLFSRGGKGIILRVDKRFKVGKKIKTKDKHFSRMVLRKRQYNISCRKRPRSLKRL